MKLISHGAAREVTGTCHELQIGGKRILLDCGLFQGNRRESMEKNATFAFDPKDIDAVILSHAHIDHSGRLPLLVKRGFRGPIYCTYATRDLAVLMLRDAAYIQEKDEEYFRKHCEKTMVPCEGPLYTEADAAACSPLFDGVNYGRAFDVIPPSTGSGQAGVKATLLDAGHILGSAMVVLEISDPSSQPPTLRIGFSGDLGRKHLPILRDPSPMPPVDILICESTYGDREHDDVASAKRKLKEVVTRTAKRGGKVLIPAFSMERTQEILYDLHLLWDAREIPAVPIFVDSPLASEVTQAFMMHPECFDMEMYQDFLSRAHHPFEFELLSYSRTTDQSKALNDRRGPLAIIAGSGMCEAGRIRHLLRYGIEYPRNTVVAVGFMAENTLGRRIVDPGIAEVKIFDQALKKRAEIVTIHAYSGHADRHDLDAFITGTRDLQHLVLVHGEQGSMEALAARNAAHRDIAVTMSQRERMYDLLEFVTPQTLPSSERSDSRGVASRPRTARAVRGSKRVGWKEGRRGGRAAQPSRRTRASSAARRVRRTGLRKRHRRRR